MDVGNMRAALLRVLMLVLGLGIVFAAHGANTTLGISSAGATAGDTAAALNVHPMRGSGTSYDVNQSNHTQDGIAVDGTDYRAISGKVLLATESNAIIPKSMTPNALGTEDSDFQVLLDTAVDVGSVATFLAQQTFTVGSHPASVTMADVNGDGKPDLIVANLSDNTVSVLLNTTVSGAATPSFAAQQTFVTGPYPYSVTAADVNGDGKPDLIVANAGGPNQNSYGTVSVLLNTTVLGAATPSFAVLQTFATGSQPTSVIAIDINGDGNPDLVVANNIGGSVSVLLNTTAPGAVTPSFAAQQIFGTGTGSYSVTAADVNGDGKPDLIVANSSVNTVSVILNTTAPGAAMPSFTAAQTFMVGVNPYSVTTADLNGDGKPDLIAANWRDGTVSVLLNATALGAATPSFVVQQTFAVGASPLSITAADVNGDGKPDLIVANSDSTVSVLLNITAPSAATTSFAAQQTFGTGSTSAPSFGASSVTVADINGDSKRDLIVANNGDNKVSVLLNTVTPVASGSSGGGASSPWLVAGLGLMAALRRQRSTRAVSALLIEIGDSGVVRRRFS